MPAPAYRTWEVEVFFDGACPLCRREIAMLRRWDRRGVIRFTDIAASDFDPAPIGRTQGDLMAEIHGRLPDGTVIKGVEVFRRLYAAVGLGPLVLLTRLPLVSQILDWGYRRFARNRLKLTGRCPTGTCSTETCPLPAASPSRDAAASNGLTSKSE